MEQRFFIYDLETFFDCFLFIGKFLGEPGIYVYEMSTRKNDREQLLSLLSWLENSRAHMIGFNSLNFDYPIIHDLLMKPYVFSHTDAYIKGQEIIKQVYGRFGGSVGFSDRKISQIDLSKINHFDNDAKRVGLKALQVAMRSESVEDLPLDPHKPTTNEQKDLLIKYGVHDVTETEKFAMRNMHLIKLRQELLDNGTLTGDVLNYDDTKIGKEYLTKKIGRGKCFAGSKPKQTIREFVKYSEVILPKIYFRTQPFQGVLDWFNAQTLKVAKKKDKKNKEKSPKLKTSLAGIQWAFGVGGVHASVEKRIYKSSATHAIIDIDVSGMYVAVAIANGFAPEHLGRDFTVAYEQLQRDRANYPKGTSMNAVLKLAGNGVYGNSNNIYSCFYDPKYTFTVTLNGQLQLAQLAEALATIPGLELIQANTDGITAYVPRSLLDFFNGWCRSWEKETGLKLEEVEYSSMFIRDVNSYIAVTTKGKVKRKGAYWWPESDGEYEGSWHKDFSNIASIKAANLQMLRGIPIEQAIYMVTDPFDFMLKYKTPAGAKVYIGDEVQNKTVRYFVSQDGGGLRKIAEAKGPMGQFKPKRGVDPDAYEKWNKENPGVHNEEFHTKNKSVFEDVKTDIDKGWLVTNCNHVKDFDWNKVNYDYYIAEAKKLVIE